MMKVATLFEIHIRSLFSSQVSTREKSLCLQLAVTFELSAAAFPDFLTQTSTHPREFRQRRKRRYFSDEACNCFHH